MRNRSLGSGRCEVRRSHNAAGQPFRVAMMSESRKCCNGVGSSHTLDLRHSGVSKVKQDRRLQRREAYRVIRLVGGIPGVDNLYDFHICAGLVPFPKRFEICQQSLLPSMGGKLLQKIYFA
ncbi:hypothetical protein NDU88_005523 [Pleurodeles waltl]|uniref:Uncharacterized protein n=1 Tax=Pleurodeles waltl TaxID=8319 RepID=A0AAV7NMN8_PLEWA|nr:hypothetical protein NDU88_005523 [Pleurodeles waltl]